MTVSGSHRNFGTRRMMAVTALLLLSLLSTSTLSCGEKRSLEWFSFSEGLQKAAGTNKKILVDVYTDWCGWCKRMDAETYGDPAVAAYLRQHFILVKLNAESSRSHAYKGTTYSETLLAKSFGITGYPTTLFLLPSGDGITAIPGYIPAADFKTILRYIGEDYYSRTSFEEFKKSQK